MPKSEIFAMLNAIYLGLILGIAGVTVTEKTGMFFAIIVPVLLLQRFAMHYRGKEGI